MNNYNDFYKPPKKLNKIKAFFISIGIFIVIVLLVAVFITRPHNSESTSEENNNDEQGESSTVFYSSDVSASVELSNNLKLKNYNSDLGYLLELRSVDNLNIFVSKEKAIENKNLAQVVEADKSSFVENFNYSNLSEIKELVVGENPAFTYSFQYLDTNLKKAFYLQIVWLQIDNYYYIFDIEFPFDDLSFYTNLTATVLSNFKVLK